jgi:hypothetical protein
VLDSIRDEQSGVSDFQGKLRFVLSYQIHSKDEAELRQMWSPDVRVPRLGSAAARVTKGHPHGGGSVSQACNCGGSSSPGGVGCRAAT